MTHTPAEIEAIAAGLTEKWCANPYEELKRPPFRAHSFDNDGRFWVVGTSRVSVLHGAHGPQEWAELWANALNATPAVRAHLEARNG